MKLHLYFALSCSLLSLATMGMEHRAAQNDAQQEKYRRKNRYDRNARYKQERYAKNQQTKRSAAKINTIMQPANSK